jgi:nicotinamidase-related amidase
MSTETASRALLLIDWINPLDFEGGTELLEQAVSAARTVARLKNRARAAGVPVIYVNDNFDSWHLGFRELIALFRTRRVPGLPLLDLLEPRHDEDHHILKPMHSGFFRTPLEVLLQRLGVRDLILTGLTADICVLFTANDAYMRGFGIAVPSDGVASLRREQTEHALRQMERALKADIRPSCELLGPRPEDGRTAKE